MKLILDILRREPGEKPRLCSIEYETEDGNATVASALFDINAAETSDLNGEPVGEIGWECSCLQKKCGACAMVINGRPRLACDTKLSEFVKKGRVRIEPLRKFPVVRDLIVDRSVMMTALIEMQSFLENDVRPEEPAGKIAYEASRCLQCGCCLEVCPNFYAGGSFKGMAAAMPSAKLIVQMDDLKRGEFYKTYRKAVYEGCGKSLSCRDICPAGIDIEGLLVNSNAAAVFKRRPFRKGKK
ncbi:MAG: 4Fe-4S dicluster domain-containing protein [Ruminococcus sp.]|nr:4Fe-4S dicluster domain-containing protein [Ruminococcus sp.]